MLPLRAKRSPAPSSPQGPGQRGTRPPSRKAQAGVPVWAAGSSSQNLRAPQGSPNSAGTPPPAQSPYSLSTTLFLYKRGLSVARLP